MRVLMFGWEFPPYSSGGLGTACYGLTKGLSHNNVHVTFVVPSFGDEDPEYVDLIATDNVEGTLEVIKVDSLLKDIKTNIGEKSAKKLLEWRNKNNIRSALNIKS